MSFINHKLDALITNHLPVNIHRWGGAKLHRSCQPSATNAGFILVATWTWGCGVTPSTLNIQPHARRPLRGGGAIRSINLQIFCLGIGVIIADDFRPFSLFSGCSSSIVLVIFVCLFTFLQRGTWRLFLFQTPMMSASAIFDFLFVNYFFQFFLRRIIVFRRAYSHRIKGWFYRCWFAVRDLWCQWWTNDINMWLFRPWNILLLENILQF